MKRVDKMIIKHHGVLGMKWGVRNDPDSSGDRKEKNDKGIIQKTFKNISQKIKKIQDQNIEKMNQIDVARVKRNIAWIKKSLQNPNSWFRKLKKRRLKELESYLKLDKNTRARIREAESNAAASILLLNMNNFYPTANSFVAPIPIYI